jgi:hypothetical protein
MPLEASEVVLSTRSALQLLGKKVLFPLVVMASHRQPLVSLAVSDAAALLVVEALP